MKKQLTAVALTAVLLGGGFAFTAAPANAATAKPSVSKATQIKKLEEKIRIHKLQLTTDKTIGNAADIKARKSYTDGVAKFDAGYKIECEARGIEKVFLVTKKSSSKNTKAYVAMNNEMLKNAKSKFNKSYSLIKAYDKDTDRSFDVEAKKGKVFQHQIYTRLTFDDRFNNLDCQNSISKEMKKTVAKYGKSINTKDQSKIKQEIKKIDKNLIIWKSQVVKYAKYEKQIAIDYDNAIKKNIKKYELQIKNLKK